MLIIGIPISILITLLPGLLAVRLLRKENLYPLDSILYAVGLGLVFNILVGVVANFTFGISLPSVAIAYTILLVPLIIWSWRFGKNIQTRWLGWKRLVIPVSLYLLAVALQLQTTLMSPNLVGSDIHLEYFVSNMVLEQGSWNPTYAGGSTLNTSLGLTLLVPIYKLLTGIELLWVFKVICPLVFAIVSLILYRIFKPQFGIIVSVLAAVFFMTMPMFTMDMVQLVRQQQSLLFFMLVVLVLLDENLSFVNKVVAGSVFTVGVMVTHIGVAIGFLGYTLAGLVAIIVLARWWGNKVRGMKRLVWSLMPLAVFVLVSLVTYVGYYSSVASGKFVTAGLIPMNIVEKTVKGLTPTTWDKPPKVSIGEKADTPTVGEKVDTPTTTAASDNSLGMSEDADTVNTNEAPSFFQRYSFLDPLHKEPLAQTAIGLDFGKASALGKIWRVLQYLVELCLIVGFFKILLKPTRSMKVEYMAFVIASFLVLAGIYVLSTYGWGLGTPRIFGITLLFISPLFVVGCQAIGGWLTRMKPSNGLLVCSTLVLFIPYLVFNSGIVFEVAKLKPVGFIDVPYSVALSGHRVDIASVFTENDVVAMDWLEERLEAEGSRNMLYADTHGANLMVQRMGADTRLVSFKYIWQMRESDIGYIFLRQWNVENDMVTLYRDYATRESHNIDDYEIVRGKIEGGSVVFDNGAKVIFAGQ